MFTCRVITGPNENAIHNTFRYSHYFASEKKMDKSRIDVRIARVSHACDDESRLKQFLMKSNIAARRVLRFIDMSSSHPPFRYEMQTYLRHTIQMIQGWFR